MSGKGSVYPIDDLWRNGDWFTDAWFLKPLDGIDARRGRQRYTHTRLVELAAVLLEVFPPAVCRQQLARANGGAHVGGLFFHMWGHLVPLLEIAELVLYAASVPERLRARLSIAEEVLGAQLELELLAAARLAGLLVDHEPLGAAGPDLRVFHDYREYFVEAKLLERSEVATRAEEVERELSHLLLGRVTDRAVSMRLDAGAGEPLRLDRRGRTLIEQVAEHARVACEVFIASGFESQQIAIDGIGTLHVGAPEGNWATVNLFVLENDEYDSERAVRLVRDAASQFPARGRRIVFVEMARESDVDDAARLYKARSVTRAPYYANVDLVVFRRGDTGTGRVVATQGEQITKSDGDLIRILSEPMPPDRPRSAPPLLL